MRLGVDVMNLLGIISITDAPDTYTQKDGVRIDD